MNLLEKNLFDKLVDLKENHGVNAVKAEFESERMHFDDAFRLKELAFRAGLEFSLKIGGCASLKDMTEASELRADNVVAPMIESCYAMEKFVKTAKSVFFNENMDDVKLHINIETVTGIENLENMILSPCFSRIKGIVLGRGDLTASMGLDSTDVDSDKIFEIVNHTALKIHSAGKEVIVGGNVTPLSVQFLKKLPAIALNGFETRKIIFDAQALSSKDAKAGILKAIEFEILWIKRSAEISKKMTKEDAQRIRILESRYMNH